MNINSILTLPKSFSQTLDSFLYPLNRDVLFFYFFFFGYHPRSFISQLVFRIFLYFKICTYGIILDF